MGENEGVTITQGENCRASGRDYIENNFYSSIIFKSLKINNELKIIVFHDYINKTDVTRLTSMTFIMSFFMTIFYVYFFDFEPNIIEFLQSVVFVFVIFSIFLLSIFFFTRYFNAMDLILKDETITLTQKKKEDVILKYTQIRSLLKMKDLVGYSINLYSTDKIEPCISFNTESIHTANAVEELIINKIRNNIEHADDLLLKP